MRRVDGHNLVRGLQAGALLTAAALLLCGAGAFFAGPAEAAPIAVSFDQPGAFTWTVPAGVTTVRIDAFGASGGDCRSVRGGAGGEATAVLPVKPQQILDIHVGGQGSSCLPVGNGAGGLNGGGSGGHTGPDIGSGGGGGSDVRIGPALTDRVLVAGGGGGAGVGTVVGDPNTYRGGTGGAGGRPSGTSGGTGAPAGVGGNGGRGGTTTGGAGGVGCSRTSAPGVEGSGGNGFSSNSCGYPGGGGGGGYFGGGGGGLGDCCGPSMIYGSGGGGGGGSSLVPAGGAFPGRTRVGDGLVIISYTLTTTTVIGAPAPATVEQAVTFTATVAPTGGSGTVKFSIDGLTRPECAAQSLASAATSGEARAVCTLPAGTLLPGNHTIVARYSGGDGYEPSAATVTETVTRMAQVVNFAANSPHAALAGSHLAVSATGGASGDAVAFSLDAHSTTGACTVTATGQVEFLHPGVCLVDADQAGNAEYSAASTAVLRVVVSAAPVTSTPVALAATGAGTDGAALSGAVSVLVGLGLIIAGRRPRGSS